ncbi:hypothetical protein FSP39_019478 [Pinctada imbricata]|uniref:Cytochrome b561 domain-containing protein n=1 Tax=Pinctada imbricata TaxID=66713 RepID=A0AA88Y011_PINIB|nr:hypothetical protein FSP39_019478 [Pinctada imbricata]
MGDWMEFTLASKIDTLKNPRPWIAIAFSSDLKMGTDDVTQCIYDNGVVEVARSLNDGKLNVHIDNEGLRNQRGEMVNSIFKCSFQRLVQKSGNRTKRAANGVLFNLNEDHFLMFGDGPASGSKLQMHQKNPVVTPRKVDFQSVDVIGDVARHPLVKVHASLMVIAWIFCSGVGIMLSKFYKPVWANRTILGLKVWFQVAKIPGKEYTRAHPILGIIVTILCIINPIMALFRPGPDSKNRPFFNWAHWADGIAAQILAVITICFGVEMQKSTAPDYTVYVVIGYVIYQVLMEIALKLYDLCIDKHESEKVEALELKNGGAYHNGNSTQNANTPPNQVNGNSFHTSPPSYGDSTKKNPKDSAIKKILFAFHVLVTLAFTLTLVLLVSMF